MADEIKISELPGVTVPQGTDIFAVVQAGVTKKESVNQALMGGGAVIGPSSVTDNAIVLFDGTTGKLIKESPVVLDATDLIFPDNVSNGLVMQDAGGQQYINFDSSAKQITVPVVAQFENTFVTMEPITFLDGTTIEGMGNFNALFNFTGNTSVIFPTSGTLATTSQIPSVGNSNTFYVDGAVGSDITGTGSVLNPYKTVSKALSVITTANASNLFTIRFQGPVLETALAVKPWVSIIGNGWIASQLVISGGGNITLDSSWGSVTNPQANFTNFATGSATAISFILSGGGSAAKIMLDDLLIPAGLVFTGRSTVSDILQVFNCESASGGTITDCLFFSNNSIYDSNLLYRNSAATGSFFMQAHGDLYSASLNITAGTAQTLQAFIYNSRANGSVVTGATATLSYTPGTFANGAVTTASGGTATSIQLPLIAGGTNARLTASAGSVTYSTSSAMAFSAVGSSGQIFQSAGTGTPVWTTATYPSTATTTGRLLRADGTNWTITTAAYPNTATASATILRANGTDWVPSTAFFADTYGASTILYSNGASNVQGLATANNAALYTNASGVPAMTALGNSKILASNSSGVIAGRSFTLKTTVFSIGGGATQVFTPQIGSLWCSVRMVGGGGGSGGVPATSGSQVATAQGGSGGEYAEGLFSTATMIGAGTTAQINLGAAGTGGAAGNNAGGNGGTTSVIANAGFGSTLMTAVGGTAGAGQAVTSTGISYPGVPGGTGGTGGDFRVAGGASAASSCSVSPFVVGGAGGSSYFGAGGLAPTNSGGSSGVGAGAGASSAASYPSSAARAGAVGIAGQVVITEYIIN